MPDTKIKDITAKTTVVATDELVINDVAGSNVDKKIGLDDLKTFTSDTPTLVTPVLGTPSSGTIDLANVTITGTSAEFQTANSDGSFVMLAGSQTISGVKTFSAAPIIQDNIKLSLGTGSDSTLVDTGSLVIFDFDEANVGSRSFDIQSDATSLFKVDDSIITAGVPIDVSDIELDTISARDGTLAMSVSGSTVTFAGFLDISDLEVATISARDGTLSQTISDTTGNVAFNGVIDAADAELATVSARDGSLAITIADTTGVSTFVSGAVLVAPVLGTPASGTMTNVTGTSGITGLGVQTQILDTSTLGIQFSAANQDIIGSAAGIVYDAPTGDTHAFHINSAATATFSATGLDLASGDKFSENSVNISPIGLQEIWIPAGAMSSVTTNGAEFVELELATNDIMLVSMNFDTTTSEKAQFWWTPPLNWDAGTIKFKLYWTETGGGASETVDFDMAGTAYADSDAIDAAVGTAKNVTDTNQNVDNDMQITAYSAAITVAGTAVAGEPVLLQLSRDVAADTLAVDCKVIGVMLEFTTDAAVSA